MAILEVNNLKKIYTTRFGGNSVQALSNVSFSVEAGEYVAIMGESGSGKTTLLNILAALDKPTRGQVMLEGKDITAINEKDLSAFRRNNLGFVFQDFNLLDTFNIKDNIFLPLVLSGKRYHEMNKLLTPLAAKLGITDILLKYPYEISGGQKQRASVARALITSPKLVLADEPTGALDSRSADALLKLFNGINRDGQTILMVTHSVKAASHASRVLFISDGAVFHQMYRASATSEEMFGKISDTLTMMAAQNGNNGTGSAAGNDINRAERSDAGENASAGTNENTKNGVRTGGGNEVFGNGGGGASGIGNRALESNASGAGGIGTGFGGGMGGGLDD